MYKAIEKSKWNGMLRNEERPHCWPYVFLMCFLGNILWSVILIIYHKVYELKAVCIVWSMGDFCFFIMKPFHPKNQKVLCFDIIHRYGSGILVLEVDLFRGVERGHIRIFSVSGCMTVSGIVIVKNMNNNTTAWSDMIDQWQKHHILKHHSLLACMNGCIWL